MNIKQKTPLTVKDAIAAIDDYLSPESKSELLSKTREEFVLEQHFELGSCIRDNFNLWENESLCREVMGCEAVLYQIDDVSSKLLELYYDSKMQ